MEEGRYNIIAVQRALHLLKLFNTDRNALTLSEISRLSGLNKSTILRMLYTLTAEKFLKYDGVTKKYQPGIELFRLGNVVSEAMDLRNIAKPYIEKAAEKTGLIVHIGILEGTDVVILEKLFPKPHRDSISMVSRVGGIVPVHCTGVGKVLLAFKEPAEVALLLKGYVFTRYSERTITNLSDLQSCLVEIRARGYAVNDGEHEPYIKCYTFPIFDHERKSIAAMSLTGLKEKIDEGGGSDVIEVLRETTLAISKELGYEQG